MDENTRKQELKTQLDKVRAAHLKIFGEELPDGELNYFFTSLLEFKRRKWIEGSLGDHGPEELRLFIELLDEGQKGDGTTLAGVQEPGQGESDGQR